MPPSTAAAASALERFLQLGGDLVGRGLHGALHDLVGLGQRLVQPLFDGRLADRDEPSLLALAGIPTVLFAFIHGFTAGIVTAVVFAVYTQVENHVLNPVVMSKTVRINPLLVFIAVLVGASLGSLIGGISGGFVAALLAIPTAGALQVLVKEVWQATAADQPQESPAPRPNQQASTVTLSPTPALIRPSRPAS